MARVTKAGYDAKAVAAYINDQITHEESKQNKPLKFLNGVRMSTDDQRRVHRWANDAVTADLAAVDRVLIRHDLALWEFEHWATEKFGDSTFFDTTAPVLR